MKRSTKGGVPPAKAAYVLPSDISADNVYFAFSDGSLTYDCVSCNANCCRGHGFTLNSSSEEKAHLNDRPNLHIFTNARDNHSTDNGTVVRNCPPACFFLTEAGLCGIHLEHGYGAKPETCRLFPFNQFYRVGDFWVVQPHPSLCPLEIVPYGSSDDKSRHDILLREMQRRGISRPVGMNEAWGGASGNEAVALELAIRHASQRHQSSTDYIEFAVVQLELTLSLIAWPKYHCADVEDQTPLDEMREFTGMVCRLLGVSTLDDGLRDLNLTRTIVVATPLLRARLLCESSTHSANAIAGPLLLRTPHILLGIYILALAARSAGMKSITLQTLFYLSSSYSQILKIMSCVNRVMVWKPGVLIPLELSGPKVYQLPYLRISKALLASEQRKQQRTLGDIICKHCVFESTDRMQFLTLVFGILQERIASMPEAALVRPRLLTQIRCLIQRSALAIVDAKYLIGVMRKRIDKPSTH